MFSVTDPGFPQGGGANSPGGAPTYDFAKFSQKLHEIERIWTPGARPSHPLRSATGFIIRIIQQHVCIPLKLAQRSKSSEGQSYFMWRPYQLQMTKMLWSMCCTVGTLSADKHSCVLSSSNKASRVSKLAKM